MVTMVTRCGCYGKLLPMRSSKVLKVNWLPCSVSSFTMEAAATTLCKSNPVKYTLSRSETALSLFHSKDVQTFNLANNSDVLTECLIE